MKRTTVKNPDCCPTNVTAMTLKNIFQTSSEDGEGEFLLMEDDSFILLESGDKIELE